MKNKLIDNIKNVRKKKGISQESLAYDLGIDYSTYGKIERGQIGLSVDRLERIAQILDLSVEDLYGWKKKEDNEARLEDCLREQELFKKEIEILKKRLKEIDYSIKSLEAKKRKD